MSSIDDLHWVRIEGLTPDVTEDDIVAYFQSARCGSGIVKILVYPEKKKTAAVIGIEGIDANGVKKINKGGHKISGKKLRLKADRKPLLSELQHAITFSSDSVTSQVMQSPAQPQQDTQSKIKNLATSRSTNEAGASSTSTSAQGIALATATDKHPITETEVSESTIEQIKPESVPSHFGSPVKAQSAPFDSRVVRVEGVLPDWDEETLNMAFDDEDEGGGEIEDNGIQIKGDEALITFKDPEVAQRVSLKKSWKICGDIRVTVSSVVNQLGALQEKGGECIKANTILLVDIPEGVTEELLKSYLSIVTKLELDDFSLEHKGNTALMVLHGDAAGSLEATVLSIQSHEKLLEGKRLKASRLTPVQSVLVTNIKAEMCKEHNLAIYFEKRKLSGGGNLHAVKVIAEGQAIVIFLEAEVAERVLTSNHAGKLGAEVVLQPHQLELSSLSGTISGARGGNIQQKSSISPRKMRSTEKQYVELPDVPDVSVLPDVRLKVKGDTVLKHQPGHLQLLLEDQVPELKGMKLIIHTTEKQDTVLVQISQADAASLSLPVTIDNERAQLTISKASVTELLQWTMPLNDFSTEDTVIVENIPPCDSSELEMYIESVTHCECHLIRTKESPSTALLTGLQGPAHVEKVLGQLNNPKRRLKECTLFAEKWPEINQVILHGLEEMVAQEVLETYFRDEEKSGSHTFADVTLKGKGIAVVTLQGRQDVKRVVEKDTHWRFFGRGVVVKLYHPKLIPWLKLSQQELRILNQGDNTHPPIAVNIPLDLFKFLNIRQYLQKPLEDGLMKICAKYELSRGTDGGIITVYPEAGCKGHEECQAEVRKFLAMFDTVEIDLKRETDRNSILEYIVALGEDKEKVEATQSKDKSKVCITGLKDSVKAECDLLNGIIKDHTQTALKEKLEIEKLQCIELCQRKALESKHPKVTFKVLHTESSLAVKGEEVLCREFLKEVSALRPNVVDVQLPPEAIILLGAKDHGKKLFREVMQKYPNVGHYTTDTEGRVLSEDLSACAHLKIITCTDAKQAVQAAQEVKECVTVITVDVPVEFTNTVRQDCWVEARRRMEEEHIALFKPQLEEDPPIVLVVCKADRAAAVKVDIKEFVNRECYTKVVIKLKEGQYKYMDKESGEWKELRREMEKLQREKQLKFRLPEKARTGRAECLELTIERFTTKVKQVEQRVRDIQSKICEDSCSVSKPGLVEYCKSSTGQQQLIGIASERNAVLLVRTGEEQQMEETTIARDLPHKPVVCASTIGGGKIEIMQGDLTEYPVDILVNAANIDLQHGGGIAGQISRKGGPEIQEESTKYIQIHGRLKVGDAVLLYAKGVLPCKAIIHTVGPKWAGGRANEEETIAKAVHGSLHLLAETDSAHYKSIAFPALSTGIYGVPLDVSARGMLAGVRKFFDNNPNSTLRVVIMLYKEEDIEPFVSSIKNDLDVQPFTKGEDGTLFEEDFKAKLSVAPSIKPQRPPRPQASPSIPPRPSLPQASPGTVQMQSEQVVQSVMDASAADKLEVRKGTLTDYKADVCINTTSSSLNLSGGKVSKSLLENGGKTLQDQCNKYVKDHGKVPVWGFATTSGGDTPFNFIIHTVGGKYNHVNAAKGMDGMIAELMTECDRLKASSVAFPALGTGVLGFPPDVAARIMVQGTHQYLQQRSVTSVKKVIFVIFQDAVFDAFQREVASLTSVSAIFSGPVKAQSVPQVLSMPSSAVSQKYMAPLPIVVKKGSLTDAQVDVYVNTVNSSLDLSNGAVANSLLKAGGPALQDECTRYNRANGDVAVWNIATTGGAGLMCKHVIHTVGSQYNGAASEKGMKSMVEKVMAECDRLKALSVALPALGTGVLGFHPEVTARILVQVCNQYLQGNPRTSVKKIVFVIFDDVGLNAFQKEVAAINPPLATSSVLPGAQALQTTVPKLPSLPKPAAVSQKKAAVLSSQPLPIVVKKGPLTDAQVEVYVNTSRPSLDLSYGAVSQSLLKAGGPALQDECTRYNRANGDVAVWNIATTGGARLKCKYVIHAVGEQYDGTASEKGMESMIGKVMAECDHLKASSVAFPAIGTGAHEFPPDVTARIMVQAVHQYLLRNSKTSLRNIVFYIYDDYMCSAFQKEVAALGPLPTVSSVLPGAQPLPSVVPSQPILPKNPDIRDSVSVVPTHAKSAPGSVENEDTHAPADQSLQMTVSSEDISVLNELHLDELRIQFVKGNVTEACSDCLVNVASPGPSGLQGDFLKKGGQKLQLAYLAATKEKGNLTKGKIIATAGPVGELKCKLVCHICPPDKHKELKETVKSVLEKAEKAHCHSVAIPIILESGKKEFSVDKVAEYNYKALASFTKDRYVSLAKVIFIDPNERVSHQFFNAFNLAASKDRTTGLFGWGQQKFKAWTSTKRRSSDAAAATKPRNPAPRPLTSRLTHNFDEEGPAIWITAYASTETVAKMVTKEVLHFVNTQFREEVLDANKVPHLEQLLLQPHTTEKLSKEAERKNVTFTIKDQSVVVLQGHKHDTEQVMNSVRKELSKIATVRDRIERDEAVQQRKQAELQAMQATAEMEQAELAKQEAERRTQHAEIRTQQAEDDREMQKQQLEHIKMHGERPDDWDPMDIDPLTGTEVPYMAVDISPGSTEYTKVEKQFSTSMGGVGSFIRGLQLPYRGVLKIQRIQNPVLYGQYDARKKAMAKANPSTIANERQLFHGCPGDVTDNINSSGFNRSYCGKNATAYGEGVYFAKDATYSARDTYTPRDGNGHKYMYLAKVLTGEFTKGYSGMKEPPAKDSKNKTMKFDSAVNDVNNPQIFVVFFDGQAYPEYLITFH